MARCTRSRAPCETQLLLDMRLVGLDRLDAEPELLRDPPRSQPLPIIRKTSSSRSLRRASGGPLRLPRARDQLAQHRVRDALADVDLAAQDAAQATSTLLGRLLLHDVAVGAGPERPLGVDRLVVHRQHQDRQCRRSGVRMVLISSIPSGPGSEMSTMTMSGRSWPIAVQRGVRLFGLAADDQIRLLVDQQRESLADDRMVVHDEHAVLPGAGGTSVLCGMA